MNLCSVRDATKKLGIGRSLLYTLIRSKELDVVKLGRRTLVTGESIQRLIERRTVIRSAV